MPITADNYQKAEDFIARASLDPNFDPARLAKLRADLETFKTGQSQSVPYRDESQREPASQMRGSVGGYFYEPNVDEFRTALKDRSVREKLGLGDTYGEQTAGRQYLESKVPALSQLHQTDVSQLSENSPEYKSYADYAYQQAKQKNPDISRYSELDVTNNPFKKSIGAIIKYGPAAVLGAEKPLTLGSARGSVAQAMVSEPPEPGGRAFRANRPQQSASQTAADVQAQKDVLEGAKTLESLSPGANTAGEIGGYLVPEAPANLAAKGLGRALAYEAANPFLKPLIGSVIGSTVSAGEGAAQDIFSNPNISGSELASNAIPRAVWGGTLGGVSDLLAQGANKTQTAFEESPRWAPIKNQKDIGGDTNFITGIQTTPTVRENVRLGTAGRQYMTPQDIAARKVAVPMQTAQEAELAKAASDINKQVEEYVKSPYGLEEHPATPAVDRLLSMADKGAVSMPVSGKYVSANRGAADAIRKNLQEFSEFQHVSTEEAQALAQKHEGRVLTTKQADILGLPNEQDKVHVVIPSKFNAEALLKKEDQIARNLKFDTKEGGVDNPVLQELDQAFREIRDRFKYDAEHGHLTSSAPNSPNAPKPETPPLVERRGPGRPTNEEWQAMQKPEGVNRNTPISEAAPQNTIPSEPNKSSVGAGDTEPPPIRSEPVPYNEAKGNKRYQEPTASEYAKMQTGESVDKSGNGYQRLVDTEDFAPSYRLRANPNEVSNLNKLYQDTVALDDIYKSNPGISEADAQKALEAKASLPEQNYSPEFPASEAEKTGWAAPFRRGEDNPFTPQRITKQRSEWTPNQDLYTDNPPESIAAEEYKSVAAEPNKSLFPEVKDQAGIPNKSEMARAEQTPDVGKVKEIVDKTDKAAAGLTPEELDAIHSYTSRKGEKVGTPEWESATKKLTVDKPTEGGALYHGTRLPQAKIDEILKNKSFSMSKPTSTSYNRDIASAMAHSRAGRGEPVIFHVDEIDNGVSLASRKLGIRGTNNEKEILLNNKDFEVSGTSKDSDGNLVINLKQKITTPEQLKATHKSGKELTGFSALRNKQHEILSKLEETKKRTGGSSEESAHNQVLGYKTGEGRPYKDEALINEAEKLGLRQQLEEVPATREYPGLRARAFAGGGEGPMNTLKDFLGFRLDPVLGAIAGQGVNPYTAMPNTPAGRIQQYLFRQGVPFYPLLEGKAGLAGARYGNEVADRNRK